MEGYPLVFDHIQSDYVMSAQTATVHRHPPPPSSSSDVQISFKFSCHALFSEWISHQDSTQNHVLATIAPPLMTETFVVVNQHQLLCNTQAQDIIRQKLRHWLVWVEAREILIEFAIDQARVAYLSMPASDNVVYLDIRVAAVHKCILKERRELIDWVVQHSMDVDEVGMVPADDSSIEALETRKILILMDSWTCSVCLEEFSKGCEAVCLPCAHVFHENCIKKWLRNSHYCPVCRFEMPTR